MLTLTIDQIHQAIDDDYHRHLADCRPERWQYQAAFGLIFSYAEDGHALTQDDHAEFWQFLLVGEAVSCPIIVKTLEALGRRPISYDSRSFLDHLLGCARFLASPPDGCDLPGSRLVGRDDGCGGDPGNDG